MAIDLKQVTNGKQSRPPRVLAYGFEGVGKTGFAAGAPDPFFLDLNRGSHAYDVQRAFPESWSQTLDWLDAVEKGSIRCKTVVLDVLSDLEHMGNLEFFGGQTITAWGGGYGKGQDHALMKWRELLAALERIWNQDKAIVFVGHAQVKHFDDPSGPGYDRYVVSMNEKIAGLVKGWCDYNFFCREEIIHQKVGGKDGDMKAVTTGRRYAYTKRCPAYDAKARGTTEFPESFSLSWDEFTRARVADEERIVTARKEIDAMLAEIGDKTLKAKVDEYLRANPNMIVVAKNTVTTRLEEKKAAAGKVAEVTK